MTTAVTATEKKKKVVSKNTKTFLDKTSGLHNLEGWL